MSGLPTTKFEGTAPAVDHSYPTFSFDNCFSLCFSPIFVTIFLCDVFRKKHHYNTIIDTLNRDTFYKDALSPDYKDIWDCKTLYRDINCNPNCLYDFKHCLCSYFRIIIVDCVVYWEWFVIWRQVPVCLQCVVYFTDLTKHYQELQLVWDYWEDQYNSILH